MTDVQTSHKSLRVLKGSGSLIRLGVRPRLNDYISDIWSVRHFVVAQARFQAFTAARGNFLGKLWLVLDPLFVVGFYYIIFGLILKTDRGVTNFVAFLAIGVIFFRPLQGALTRGNSILKQNRSLFRSFNFPKTAVFLSYIIRATMESLPDIAVLAVFIILIPPHVTPSFSWLLLPVVIFLRQLMILGLAMLAGFAAHKIPDLLHVWPVLSRFWFYASGVLFSIEKYVSNEVLRLVLEVNPAAVLLTAARAVLLDGTVPPLALWLQLVGWAFCLSLIGVLVIWKNEVELNRVQSR